MLTIPRDRSTVDSIQELLIELFGARDKLGAAADVLADADDRYICRKLSFQLGGNAADLQQIVSASGVQPAGPRSEHDARQSLSSIQKHIGPNGVLDTAEQTEQMLTEKYEQTMRHLNDPEVTGLLERQRGDVEFADRVLRRLKASAATVDQETCGVSGELRQRVERFLITRGIRGMEGVRVDVDGGVVVLRGRIASAHDRWLCVSCAGRVAGVLRVVDELEVEDVVTRPWRPK